MQYINLTSIHTAANVMLRLTDIQNKQTEYIHHVIC